MTSFSSFLPSKLLNINNRDRSSDPLSRLRFALETMPGSRKYEFTPMTRTEIITELYDAFWGSHTNLFVSNPSANLPLHTSLYELQHRLGFGGAGKERKPIPGRSCGNIFKKGECCFRCRCVAFPSPINNSFDPSRLPAIARGTTVVFFAQDASTLQIIRATTLASSSLNSPEVAVIAEMLKLGACRLVVPTTLQRRAQAKPQKLSRVTSQTSRTHNQSRTSPSRRNCRRRCERQWPTPLTSSWTHSTTPPTNRQSQQTKQISGCNPLRTP